MRPTTLNYRSPKEVTAEMIWPRVFFIYIIQVTYDGRRTVFPHPKPQRSPKPTFPKERRFMQYYIDEKRTNVVVGPATYETANISLKDTKGPCSVLYVIFINFQKQAYHARMSSEGYTMAGCQIVYEPRLTSKQEAQTKKKIGIGNCSVDLCSIVSYNKRQHVSYSNKL